MHNFNSFFIIINYNKQNGGTWCVSVYIMSATHRRLKADELLIGKEKRSIAIGGRGE